MFHLLTTAFLLLSLIAAPPAWAQSTGGSFGGGSFGRSGASEPSGRRSSSSSGRSASQPRDNSHEPTADERRTAGAASAQREADEYADRARRARRRRWERRRVHQGDVPLSDEEHDVLEIVHSDWVMTFAFGVAGFVFVGVLLFRILRQRSRRSGNRQ